MPSDQALFQSLSAVYGIPDFGFLPFSAVKDSLIPCRGIKRLPQNAKTVIMMLFPYYIAPFPERNISLYAVVPDYHTVVGELLKDLARDCENAFHAQFVPFTDSSPIPEILSAAMAGLGAIGKNGLLLHPVYGSYCFLGELVTDYDFAAGCQKITCCIGCNACVKACPGNALSDSGKDFSRCISALTQKKKPLSPDEEEAIRKNGYVWGCDRCQTVCPYNRCPKKTPIQAFYHNAVPVITKENVSELLSDRAFAWRGEAVIRRNLALVGQKEKRERQDEQDSLQK